MLEKLSAVPAANVEVIMAIAAIKIKIIFMGNALVKEYDYGADMNVTQGQSICPVRVEL